MFLCFKISNTCDIGAPYNVPMKGQPNDARCTDGCPLVTQSEDLRYQHSCQQSWPTLLPTSFILYGIISWVQILGWGGDPSPCTNSYLIVRFYDFVVQRGFTPPPPWKKYKSAPLTLKLLEDDSRIHHKCPIVFHIYFILLNLEQQNRNRSEIILNASFHHHYGLSSWSQGGSRNYKEYSKLLIVSQKQFFVFVSLPRFQLSLLWSIWLCNVDFLCD